MNKELNYDYEYLIEQKQNLEKLDDDYKNVKNFITNLNKNYSEEIIVPVSENLAYFKTKINQPDQCKVYIGEDYFVKTSSIRAVNIIEKRKNRIETLLEGVNKQLEILNFNFSNKEIKEEKIYIDNPNLKKLGDDTFEILENFEEDAIDNKKETNLINKNLQNQQMKIKDKMMLMLNKNLNTKNNFLKENIIEELKPKSIDEIKETNTIYIPPSQLEETVQNELIKKSNKKKDIMTVQKNNFNNKKEIETDEDEPKRSIFFHDNDE